MANITNTVPENFEGLLLYRYYEVFPDESRCYGEPRFWCIVSEPAQDLDTIKSRDKKSNADGVQIIAVCSDDMYGGGWRDSKSPETGEYAAWCASLGLPLWAMAACEEYVDDDWAQMSPCMRSESR